MNARILILATVFAAALLVPASVPADIHIRNDDDHGLCRGDDVSIDFDDDSIVFTDEESEETVEITQRGDLFINGKGVRLSRSDRGLAKDYYATLDAIVEEAKSIGLQGAKVGVKGAALGLKAAVGVLLLLSPSYDTDDLEEDLEEDEEELERVASKLERRAERLERRADKLERMHEDLRDRIDALDELGWF
ncbi:MAG: hypothetical protein JW952_03405 [Candidatus Eisenbacteria bacterium]|nr:hypothetical protein [Candidatus Eisenbacteria bacterium]